MIFEDESVLEPEYVPRRLIVRNLEMEKLMQNILNAFHVSIYGPVGSGKTLVIKAIMKNFSDKKENKIMPAYIDCTRIIREWPVVSQIRSQLNLPVKLGKSPYEYLDETIKFVQNNNLKLWVIFDEYPAFVKVSGENMIKALLDYGAILTLISMTPDAQTMLSQSIISRLGFMRMTFPPYTKEQLFTILKQRVEEGNGKVTDEALTRIAEHASITGDARLAIFILKNAVMKAKEENAERVEVKHVENVLENVYQMMIHDIASKLSPHEQAYLKAVIELYNTIPEDEITSGRVYEAYQIWAKNMQLQPLSITMINTVIIPHLTGLNIIMMEKRTGKRGRTHIITPNPLLLTKKPY